MKKLIFVLSVAAIFNCKTSIASCPVTDTIKPLAPYIFTGATTTLTDTNTHGGTYKWKSSNTAIATIDSSAGVVSPVIAGTVIITYSYHSDSCHTYKTITVNPLPNPPFVVVQKGNANYITIDGQNYKREWLGTHYNYSPGDSEVSVYNMFSNKVPMKFTIDTNVIYFDSSNQRANNMINLRNWFNTNLE